MKKWMSEQLLAWGSLPSLLSLPLPFISGFSLHNLIVEPVCMSESTAPPSHVPFEVADKQQMGGLQKKTFLPGA